jgi:predicted GNAT family N-acyltransferase
VNYPPFLSLSLRPLDEQLDRSGFDSGSPELDRYFHFQAGQDAKRRVAAPFVLFGQDEKILGYYTLSAYGIRLSDLPEEIAKRFPKYPILPATLLGRLAISREHQGRKLGQFLLMDALKRSYENTRDVGSVGVVVDALDARAEAFYRHHEFSPMAGHSSKLFLAMATIRRLFHE